VPSSSQVGAIDPVPSASFSAVKTDSRSAIVLLIGSKEALAAQQPVDRPKQPIARQNVREAVVAFFSLISQIDLRLLQPIRSISIMIQFSPIRNDDSGALIATVFGPPASETANSGPHPPGVWILATTEVWERFSYYGMRALLVFYMTKQLMISQADSSTIYGVYTAGVWFTPFIGGIVADRFLGQHRAVLLGGSLMALGHFLMTFVPFFFVALGLIAVGNGLFKPNVSTQVGDLYQPNDPRRDRGYSLFYVGVNFGAFIAPLGCGTVGEIYGWHWGFGLAAVGMVCGLAVYSYGRKWLPPDRRTVRREMVAEAHSADFKRIVALAAISLAASLFWMIFEQQGNVMALWADTFTNRTLQVGSWHWTIPASWFPGLNGFFIVTLTPAVLGYWKWQSTRGREPHVLNKMAIGALLASASYVLMIIAAFRQQSTALVSWLWLVGYFLVLTLGDLYLSPTCLSLFNKIAPGRLASTLLGVWYMSMFIGSYLAGASGRLWSTTAKPLYFLAMAAVGVVCALLLYIVGRTSAHSLELRS
jgi:POT family proton-dependent oligopeptide transporter